MFVTLARGFGEARTPVSTVRGRRLMPSRLDTNMLAVRMCPASDNSGGGKNERVSGDQASGASTPTFSSVKDGVRIGLALMLLRNPGLRQKLAALAQAIAAQQPPHASPTDGDAQNDDMPDKGDDADGA